MLRLIDTTQVIFNDVIGEDIHYHALYDQINERRRHDLFSEKQPEWNEIEVLCCEILTYRSKDLQIVGWLVESWIHLYYFEGCAKGLSFFNRFIQRYWEQCYPVYTETEYRLRILEWIDKTIGEALLSVPLVLHPQVRLSDWIHAKHFSSADTEEIQALIHQIPWDTLSLMHVFVKEAKITLSDLNKTISMYGMPYSFSHTNSYLEVFESLLESKKKGEAVLASPLSVSPPIEDTKNDIFLHNRDDVYGALKSIGDLLKQIDPHSPSPYFIDLILSWKDKNIVQIARDIQTGEGEVYQIIRLFNLKTQKKNENK